MSCRYTTRRQTLRSKGHSRARLAELRVCQRERPVLLFATKPGRTYWWFSDRYWWEDDHLDADDVRALVLDRDRRKRRALERAYAVAALEQDPPASRPRDRIPKAVMRAVFERDAGACVECGEAFQIQYDHVIPHSLGGADTVENLQLMCAPCNRLKGASLA